MRVHPELAKIWVPSLLEVAAFLAKEKSGKQQDTGKNQKALGRRLGCFWYLLSAREGMVEAGDISHDSLLIGTGRVDNV